jgi:hypothetical protein
MREAVSWSTPQSADAGPSGQIVAGSKPTGGGTARRVAHAATRPSRSSQAAEASMATVS